MNLSPTMMQVTEQMELHGELIRYPGGFWSWRDVEIKREIPVWYCDVKTLRALGKRGIVNLDETKKICKPNRYLRRKFMNDKQRLMIEGMDRLLRRFNKYPNDKEFTVEEIIEVSNEIYDEIVKEEN